MIVLIHRKNLWIVPSDRSSKTYYPTNPKTRYLTQTLVPHETEPENSSVSGIPFASFGKHLGGKDNAGTLFHSSLCCKLWGNTTV